MQTKKTEKKPAPKAGTNPVTGTGKAITLEKIIMVAEALADEAGFFHFTLKQVSDGLKIKPPSLYNHIKNLEDIREHLTWKAFTELNRELKDAVIAVDGQSALRNFSKTCREFAKKKPGLYQAMLPTFVTMSERIRDAAMEQLHVLLQILKSAGIPEKDLVHVARSLRSSLHGFIDLESKSGFGLNENIEKSFEFHMNLWFESIEYLKKK